MSLTIHPSINPLIRPPSAISRRPVPAREALNFRRWPAILGQCSIP
jgi:hypothetical protein